MDVNLLVDTKLTKSVGCDAFFYMNESMEILLVSNPFPSFVATLLQLSKLVRRNTWDFLTSTTTCTHEWSINFLQNLYKYKQKRPPCTDNYWSLHPIFVYTPERFPTNTIPQYYIGQLIMNINDERVRRVLVGEFYTYKNKEISWPGWEISNNLLEPNCFDWYFVAAAFALRMNKMIVHNASCRWTEEPIIPNDAELFIAYK